MQLAIQDLVKMIDLTAVRAEDDEAGVRALAKAAKEYRPICVCVLPGHTPLLRDLLVDEPDIHIVGAVGFPSGGNTIATKTAEARELLGIGCSELDMVINIGLLCSGSHQRVLDDIRGVVDVAGDAPVKVILECHYLSDDQIRVGCELCIRAGASFIKTSTGWAPTGATLQNVALIKSCVGDAIAIKAAGGIRNLDVVIEMYRLGARRFGIGLSSAIQIFEECAARPGGTLE